jgi:hypothetical protein
MASRCSLGIFLLVLVSISTACTTGRMVPMQTQPGTTAPRGLKSGDRIRVHTHDGRHSDFDFDHVAAMVTCLARITSRCVRAISRWSNDVQ